MILYPFLISLALAGGPAANAKMKLSKRNPPAVKEFVAITAFPNITDGTHYCLRYYGASVAELEECDEPDLEDDMSLFSFEPLDRFGNYTMKSAYDGLCVNFTEGVNPLTLAMAECGGNGTRVPWFFQWNTYGKNPGDDSFSDPKYAAISSPYSGMKNISELSSNECYFPNKDGGIDTAQCSDSQNMTWFGYATPNAPKKSH